MQPSHQIHMIPYSPLPFFLIVFWLWFSFPHNTWMLFGSWHTDVRWRSFSQACQWHCQFKNNLLFNCRASKYGDDTTWQNSDWLPVSSKFEVSSYIYFNSVVTWNENKGCLEDKVMLWKVVGSNVKMHNRVSPSTVNCLVELVSHLDPYTSRVVINLVCGGQPKQ